MSNVLTGRKQDVQEQAEKAEYIQGEQSLADRKSLHFDPFLNHIFRGIKLGSQFLFPKEVNK